MSKNTTQRKEAVAVADAPGASPPTISDMPCVPECIRGSSMSERQSRGAFISCDLARCSRGDGGGERSGAGQERCVFAQMMTRTGYLAYGWGQKAVVITPAHPQRNMNIMNTHPAVPAKVVAKWCSARRRRTTTFTRKTFVCNASRCRAARTWRLRHCNCMLPLDSPPAPAIVANMYCRTDRHEEGVADASNREPDAYLDSISHHVELMSEALRQVSLKIHDNPELQYATCKSLLPI